MVDALLSLYPTDPRLGCPYNTGTVKLTAGALDKQACSIFGDLVQIAPARMIAQSLTQHNGKAPVYRFRFNHLPSGSDASSRGIGTGVEQSYVFSNLVPNSPYDKALAYEMSSAWVSFAHDLNPNPGGGKLPPPHPPAVGANLLHLTTLLQHQIFLSGRFTDRMPAAWSSTGLDRP